MIHGSWLTALIDVSEDADLTAEVNLGRVYETILIIAPAKTVSAQISLQVAQVTGGTFQDLYDTDRTDGTSHQIISVTGTGAFTWIVPLGGFQYIKVKLSANQTGADQTYKVMGVRS